MRVDDDMKLPDGMTCADCINAKRCEMLLGIKGDETTCDWAPSRFRMDCIGVLGRLLDEAGATLTLYGKQVTADEVREFTTTIAKARIAAALDGKIA